MAPFTTRERAIITHLSKHFYVTRTADIAQIGNSSYRSFLMRPSENVSVVLNVEREIVVLFADYETFEARTLTAFEMTYRQFDDVRVDRSLRFLISADKNIEPQIRHYLQQNPEYPIVIPFHYDAFSQHTEQVFFSSIRRNYLVRDLFGYQSPLRYEYFFFGRSQLVENVIDLHKSGQNSGLFGLRKSGKTSTIYAIRRRARTAGCKTLVVDCQDPAVHAKRFATLIEYIVSQARKELGLKRIDTTTGNSPDKVAENFRRLMDQTLIDARSDILVIFDEIENISPRTAASPHWRESTDTILLWQTLRSFFQDAHKYKLTFCFVGTNPHLFELPKIHDIDNPVYLFAPKTFIPMLDLSETSEMISRLGYFMGLDFDAAVISHIHRRFGGHPFFIRQLCSRLHKQHSLERPQTVSINSCKKAEEDSIADITGYLAEILNSLKLFYPDEYTMLEYLAGGNQQDFFDFAVDSPAYIEHLIGYGIVVRRNNDFEFAFDAVAEAVKTSLSRSEPLSLERKRTEINQRRNVLEEEMRSFLFITYSMKNHDTWVKAFDSCITQSRKSQLGVLSCREAFSRRQSPLYLTELLQFIKRSGDFENSVVSLSDISSSIQVVNAGRADAHAKDISDEEYTRVIRAIELLESVFLPP